MGLGRYLQDRGHQFSGWMTHCLIQELAVAPGGSGEAFQNISIAERNLAEIIVGDVFQLLADTDRQVGHRTRGWAGIYQPVGEGVKSDLGPQVAVSHGDTN